MSVDGFDLTGRDVAAGITGQSAADASRQASLLQAQSGKDAIKAQKEALNKIRGDLSKFRKAGADMLPGLSELISDPNAQLNFVQNNPFFNAMAKQAKDSLFANQAARGKLGSGDTAAGLQDRLLLLGNSLLDNSINQRFNLATMGANAAAQTGTMTQNSGNSISDLLTGIGNAGAAGQIGVANAMGQGASNAMTGLISGLGLALSDRRMKTDARIVGELTKGIPLYIAKYVGCAMDMFCVMAQDVEPIFPGVVCDVFGVKYVDYDELQRVLH